MRKKTLLGALLFLLGVVSASAAPARPKITGLAYVRFYTTDRAGAQHLYGDGLGLTLRHEKGMDVYLVGASQRIEMDAKPGVSTDEPMLEEIGFETSDPLALEQYLRSRGVTHFTKIPGGFFLTDRTVPRIAFVKHRDNPAHDTSSEVSHQIIHAGFTVKDRAQEDPLFLTLLGFKPYWMGGRAGNATDPDWVSLQTPDAHEWIEYMLHPSPHDNARQRGSAFHVSLGVVEMNAAIAKLKANGWSDPKGAEMKPQPGLDGKYQYNLWDPDSSRIELMEFAPYTKPCCSEFTQPNPSPGDR